MATKRIDNKHQAATKKHMMLQRNLDIAYVQERALLNFS